MVKHRKSVTTERKTVTTGINSNLKNKINEFLKQNETTYKNLTEFVDHHLRIALDEEKNKIARKAEKKV